MKVSFYNASFASNIIKLNALKLIALHNGIKCM